MNQKSLDKKKTKELDWEIELYTLLNKHADKKDFYWTQLGEDLTKLISSLLQKQRTELLEEIKTRVDTWGGFEDDGGNLCHYDSEILEWVNDLLNKKDEQI